MATSRPYKDRTDVNANNLLTLFLLLKLKVKIYYKLLQLL